MAILGKKVKCCGVTHLGHCIGNGSFVRKSAQQVRCKECAREQALEVNRRNQADARKRTKVKERNALRDARECDMTCIGPKGANRVVDAMLKAECYCG